LRTILLLAASALAGHRYGSGQLRTNHAPFDIGK
jgi:hypothetical protein